MALADFPAEAVAGAIAGGIRPMEVQHPREISRQISTEPLQVLWTYTSPLHPSPPPAVYVLIVTLLTSRPTLIFELIFI